MGKTGRAILYALEHGHRRSGPARGLRAGPRPQEAGRPSRGARGSSYPALRVPPPAAPLADRDAGRPHRHARRPDRGGDGALLRQAGAHSRPCPVSPSAPPKRSSPKRASTWTRSPPPGTLPPGRGCVPAITRAPEREQHDHRARRDLAPGDPSGGGLGREPDQEKLLPRALSPDQRTRWRQESDRRRAARHARRAVAYAQEPRRTTTWGSTISIGATLTAPAATMSAGSNVSAMTSYSLKRLPDRDSFIGNVGVAGLRSRLPPCYRAGTFPRKRMAAWVARSRAAAAQSRTFPRKRAVARRRGAQPVPTPSSSLQPESSLLLAEVGLAHDVRAQQLGGGVLQHDRTATAASAWTRTPRGISTSSARGRREASRSSARPRPPRSSQPPSDAWRTPAPTTLSFVLTTVDPDDADLVGGIRAAERLRG